MESLIGLQASGKPMPSQVIEHIVEKADGVPLFVEELTKAALESDFLREEEDRYTLAGSLSDLAIPATLQDSLMARLDRFPTLRELAQLGAVLGREFTYGMLQSLTPLDEPELIDGLGQLVANELLYQRGRPPRSKYIFKHALIQDAAYQSLLRRIRRQYHQQVATLIVERFPEMVTSQPELVAHHYAQAGCHEEAVDYFQKAGRDALGRSANVEAATHLEKALEYLRREPDSQARLQRELSIQMAYGPAVVAARGFGHLDVAKAYARAWELCQRLGDEINLPIVLRGRQVFHFIRGELKQSRESARQLLDFAERKDDPALVVGGCHALGQTTFMLGDLSDAREILDRGVGVFDAEVHRLPNWPGGQPGEQCYLYSAFCSWMLGFPDKAMRYAEEALELANALSNPVNLVNTLAFVATLHVLREDLDLGLQRAEATIKLGSELSNPTFLGQGIVLDGWLQVAQDPKDDGISEINRGLVMFRSTGAKAWLPYLLGLAAESYGRVRRFDDGHAAITEAIDEAESTHLGSWLADLYRIKGDLLCDSRPDDVTQAEDAYTRALEIARGQRAKSWELRAAMQLARAWQRRGRQRQARELLAPVFDWFTEGFDSADLRDAKALLAELG